jgi:hypothetical protein
VYSSDTEFRLYSDKDDIRGEAYVEEVTSPIWQDNVNQYHIKENINVDAVNKI